MNLTITVDDEVLKRARIRALEEHSQTFGQLRVINPFRDDASLE